MQNRDFNEILKNIFSKIVEISYSPYCYYNQQMHIFAGQKKSECGTDTLKIIIKIYRSENII